MAIPPAADAVSETGRPGPLLMSGGRNCVDDTVGIFLWENADGSNFTSNQEIYDFLLEVVCLWFQWRARRAATR
jgi:hypothetical protein